MRHTLCLRHGGELELEHVFGAWWPLLATTIPGDVLHQQVENEMTNSSFKVKAFGFCDSNTDLWIPN